MQCSPCLEKAHYEANLIGVLGSYPERMNEDDMRLRKKKNLGARMMKHAHLLISEPETLRGRWLEEYQYERLHIELGCGRGRFTVETAKTEPDTLLAALEKSADAMIIAVERAAAEDLCNLRFANALADNLPAYFAPGEVSRIYINFCDPWPSNGHAKRRLTSGHFLGMYRQALCPDGEIRFKTDNLALFEFSLRAFEKHGFALADISRDLHSGGPNGILTDYEQKFHDQGMPICYACARRLNMAVRQ